jgi:hypothetical protein
MNNLIFCILKTEEDLLEYEKAVFENFTKRNPNYWITKNYKKIESNRLQSRIPYEDQIVYGVKSGNKLIAGGSINKNITRKMQLEDVGFILSNENKKDNICEALLLFIYESIEYNVFTVALGLRNYLINDLYNRGYKCVYGVCSENKKLFYTKFRFYVIEEKILNNEKKYLIKIDTDYMI